MQYLNAYFNDLVQAGLKVMQDVAVIIVIAVGIGLTIFLLDTARKELKFIKPKRR